VKITGFKICLSKCNQQRYVAEWRHPCGAAAPIDAIALAAPSSGKAYYYPHGGGGGGGGGGSRPLVWAAAGRDEIALWDVAEGACRRVMRVLRPPVAGLYTVNPVDPYLASACFQRLKCTPDLPGLYLG
jgi:hypothetical protein